MPLPKFDDDHPDLDIEALESLRKILREEFDTVLQSFFRHSRVYVDQIHHGIEDNKIPDVVSAAHRLAASAGQMGFTKMARVAKIIETESPHTSPELLLQGSVVLRDACDRALIKSQSMCRGA